MLFLEKDLRQFVIHWKLKNVLSDPTYITKFLVIYLNGYLLSSMVLKIGDKAPQFTLKDAYEKEISLSDFKGKRVIIYFYPKDNTPGCTKEACNFKDNWDIIKRNNIVVIGISKDNASSHQKFIDKFDLPFILLTDLVPCQVASDYESYGLKKFMGKEYMGMIRNTFVVDSNGKIEKIYSKVKAAIMADHIVNDLQLT